MPVFELSIVVMVVLVVVADLVAVPMVDISVLRCMYITPLPVSTT